MPRGAGNSEKRLAVEDGGAQHVRLVVDELEREEGAVRLHQVDTT